MHYATGTHQRVTRLFLVSALALFGSSGLCAQVVYENDFDQHGTERVYNDDDLDNDWNSPSFNNGVTEGRVSIVGPSKAYGGTGSALAVTYPAGQHGPSDTGAQWQFEFDAEYEEVFLKYRVNFENGFDFVRGGKLPGLAGGTSPTGNTQADGVNGWTGRMMWRTDFEGVSGVPEQTTGTGISYAKYTDSGFAQDGRNEDKEFWFDSSNNAVVLESGTWYQIKQRIKMNTPGQSNGIIQIWLDDELVHDQQDVLFRTTDELTVDKMYFSTFFGGNDDWATSKDETVYFDDFEIYRPEPRFLKVPQHFATIQEAVDAATPGDVVAVRGTVYENVVVDKEIFFRGYTGTVLIARDRKLPAIRVTTGNVHLKRFEIRNGTHGILVEPGHENVTIDYMRIFATASTAIEVNEGCHGAVISKNLVLSNYGDGIKVTDSDNVVVADNKAYWSSGNGYQVTGDNYQIDDNIAVGNHNGYSIAGNSHDITDNYSADNLGAGFLVHGSDHYVFDNYSRKNGTGFSFVNATSNYVFENIAFLDNGNAFEWRLLSNNNSVVLNGARSASASGFFVDDSSDNDLTRNWSYFNSYGFRLSSTASGNSVIRCRATDNESFGFLDEGSLNTLSQNYSRRNGDDE